MLREVRKSEHNIRLFSENIVVTMQQSVGDRVPQEEHNLLSNTKWPVRQTYTGHITQTIRLYLGVYMHAWV